MPSSADLRKLYVDYFVARDHRHVRSSPLVPPDDPTLLFTNAGMVQFKPLYVMKLPKERLWATTFCEDPEAAEILEKEVGIPRDRIIPLDEKENFWGPAGETGACGPCSEVIFFTGTPQELEEAKKQSPKTIEKRIVEEGDLFFEIWNMVFPQFDQQLDGSRPQLKNRGIDTGAGLERMTTAMEFIASGGRIRSPYDTVLLHPIVSEAARLLGVSWAREASLEQRRLLYHLKRNPGTRHLVEEVRSVINHLAIREDTDRFPGPGRIVTSLKINSRKDAPVDPGLLAKVQELGANGFEGWKRTDQSVDFPIYAANAVADHIRALTFAIAEGVVPSHKGRGYVIRRILIRALRFANLSETSAALEEAREVDPFLFRLVDPVIETMGRVYPEIEGARDHVKRVVRQEEESSLRTMRNGEKRLREMLAMASSRYDRTLRGQDIFELHATYGYPPEMTKEAVDEYNLQFKDLQDWQDHVIRFDDQGYQSAMAGHKELARKSWKGGAQIAAVLPALQANITVSGKFVGYDTLECEARILEILVGAERCEEAAAGQEALIILDQTPFYAEAGGQVGDVGVLEAQGARFRVTDTTKTADGFYVHAGRAESGVFKVDQMVEAKVDEPTRRATMRNHTATHLLQGALKRIVGQHVTQSGSNVAPDGLRFDFTHFEALSPDQLRQIEVMVNEQVRANHAVTTRVLPKEDAFALGAIAPFGEKYGETVRVVKVDDFSSEFCGGTHLRATGEIGLFLLVSEASIASGVRRIEAVTGEGAYAAAAQARRTVSDLARLLAAAPDDLPKRIEALQDEGKSLRREIERMKQESSTGEIDRIMAEAADVRGAKVVTHCFDGLDAGQLRTLADVVRSKSPSSVAVLASIEGKKVTLICAVSDDLKDRVPADALVKEVAKVVGGGGGGRADLAQAGGKNPDKLSEAFAAAIAWVQAKLG
ncbi:MAG: alanine--tRNA ligase [Candidatus Sumerlaeota bacterium]|nr:alanine--tRNA ligase [Candidatus Sumerlaeota bacterium]